MKSDPVQWIEKYFYIPETRDDPVLRGRLILQPYQRDTLREALSRDENGLYKYSTVIWSDCKKSIKSTVAAAVHLYMADNVQWSEQYTIANDLKQAESRVGHYMRRAISLSPYLNKRFRSIRNKIINDITNSFIESIPIDPSGEAGSNANIVQWSEMWGAHETAKENMWCFDEETEILTRRGWLRHDEMTFDDEVATVMPVTHELVWDKPIAIHKYHYRGVMHYYGSKNPKRSRFSKLVTPNHRLYGIFSYNSKDNKYSHRGIMESKELRDSGYRVYFPLTTLSGYKHHNITEKKFDSTKFKESFSIPWKKWCAFMGIYLSDGYATYHWKSKKPTGAKITQSWKKNPHKWKSIKDLFDEIFSIPGYTIKEYKGERYGSSDFVISSSVIGQELYPLGKSKTKYIPQEIKDSNPECLREFLMWFIMGDGMRVSDTSWSIATGSKNLVDDIQEIALKLGYYATASQNATGNNWRIRISESRGGYDREIDSRNNWGDVEYDGIVWCPTTRLGLVVARRNHKPFISGQSEMTLSPTKFGKSLRWIESYAGFAEESLLLYSLWETGVKNGRLLWPDRLYDVTDGEPSPLELYVNEEARMLCLWNTQPRNPWQTREYYKNEASILTPNQFNRMHRNQWVTSEETFVPIEWWDSCRRSDDEWPQLPDKKRLSVIIAMDAAVSDDNFGVLCMTRHPVYRDEVVVLEAREWKPQQGKKLDFDGTEEDPGPIRYIKRLVSMYNVIQIAYDEYQLHYAATQMKKAGIAWLRPFSQGTDRLVADSQLRDLIRDRRIWHRGEPSLRDHVSNANAKIDTEDRKVRIVKRVKHLKVDLTVCASMASHECLRLNI